MVIREARIPANDRKLSFQNDFVCLAETAKQALLQECVAASVCERENARKGEKEKRGEGGEGIETPLSQTPCMVSTATKSLVTRNPWL